MRLFAIICYGIALFFGYTAVEAMQTGVTYSISGDTSKEHRREDPQSMYQKYLVARWLYAGGFVAVGIVMQVFAAKFEKLERDASS